MKIRVRGKDVPFASQYTEVDHPCIVKDRYGNQINEQLVAVDTETGFGFVNFVSNGGCHDTSEFGETDINKVQVCLNHAWFPAPLTFEA